MPTVYREQKANGGLIRWSRATAPGSEWIVGNSENVPRRGTPGRSVENPCREIPF